MAKKTIALFHPGNMGATIGAAAAASGARVLWASHERGAATRRRAERQDFSMRGLWPTRCAKRTWSYPFAHRTRRSMLRAL